MAGGSGGQGRKGKGKGSGKGNAKAGGSQQAKAWKAAEKDKPAANKFEGKPYEEAVNDLMSSTLLQQSDFDPWTVQVLDLLDEYPKGDFRSAADYCCASIKGVLADRTREQIKNPKAYMFKLMSTVKKEVLESDRRDRIVSGSQFRADAPEYVPGEPFANFNFKVDAPEFIPDSWVPQCSVPVTPDFVPKGDPFQVPELGSPCTTAFSLNPDSPVFVPSSVSTSPEMAPQTQPQQDLFGHGAEQLPKDLFGPGMGYDPSGGLTAGYQSYQSLPVYG